MLRPSCFAFTHSAFWVCTLHCWLTELKRRGRVIVKPTAAVGRHGVPEKLVVPRLGGIVELWLGVAIVPSCLGHLQPQVCQWLPDLAQIPGTRCRPMARFGPDPWHCWAALPAASIQRMLSDKEARQQPLLGQAWTTLEGAASHSTCTSWRSRRPPPEQKPACNSAQAASQAAAEACSASSLAQRKLSRCLTSSRDLPSRSVPLIWPFRLVT